MRFVLLLLLTMPIAQAQQQPPENPYTRLMRQAAAHAREHQALTPVLSPIDATVLDNSVPVASLQQAGIRVIPWTTNDPAKMRDILALGKATGDQIDGLISDYPDRLQAIAAKSARPVFDVEGHRGARGLRPENTLPAFEAGLDNGITTIETDTGVTADGHSLISHDQFLNPQSCRRAPIDGIAKPYTTPVYIQDIPLAEAQRSFLCDQLRDPFTATQRNDLTLSPVSVAFAAQEHLPSPYTPITAAQLFRFAAFYADYYRALGSAYARRTRAGDNVRFNLETKIIPANLPPALLAALHQEPNHTAGPQAFVDALCGAIVRAGMQARADVQSFDFRTLQLVEAQHPDILTVYLTQDARLFQTPFLPESLRQ